MGVSFFIARRYLVAKKRSSVISAISLVSMMGVAVASAALIVVLSVFNGFQDLVASYFTSFDPQLKILPVDGKTIAADDSLLLQIKQLPQVKAVHEVYEDRALAVFGERQTAVVLRGVDADYMQTSRIRSILLGEQHSDTLSERVTPGILLAQKLGLGMYFEGYLQLYAPVREGQLDQQNLSSGFVTDSLLSSGQVFQVTQPKYDEQYLLVPIAFVRRLYDAQGLVSSLEVELQPGEHLGSVKRVMRRMAGDRLLILDRFEQQSDTFRVMNIEKLLAYVFLTFILLVACFNIIGTLSMLMIDKQKDLQTLRALGASRQQIAKVFLFEGRMIAAVGAFIGVATGLVLCWLQQTYGFVRLGESDGTFVVDAYPVSVHLLDVVIVLLTVFIVSWIAVWYPVRHFTKHTSTLTPILTPTNEVS